MAHTNNQRHLDKNTALQNIAEFNELNPSGIDYNDYSYGYINFEINFIKGVNNLFVTYDETHQWNLNFKFEEMYTFNSHNNLNLMDFIKLCEEKHHTEDLSRKIFDKYWTLKYNKTTQHVLYTYAFDSIINYFRHERVRMAILNLLSTSGFVYFSNDQDRKIGLGSITNNGTMLTYISNKERQSIKITELELIDKV